VNAYVRTYIHTHIHTLTYISTYIHTSIHTCIHTYVRTYTHTYIHNTYIHTHTCVAFTCLGAFENLGNAIISFFVCVYLSFLPPIWNNSAPTERFLMKVDISLFLKKSVVKIQDSLKSDTKNGCFI